MVKIVQRYLEAFLYTELGGCFYWKSLYSTKFSVYLLYVVCALSLTVPEFSGL